MNGSFDLGKISGIDIRIHWTFLLLPAWYFFSTLADGGGFFGALTWVVFLLAVFGCVLLHELGHSLAARLYGVETRHITLLPIGGVAALERMPRNPWHELVIAVAGPAVNVVIAIAGFAAILLTSAAGASVDTLMGVMIQRLVWVNIALVVFNMIPAFPMDGGRVTRAVLAMMLPYERATNLAASLGQLIAMILGCYALFTGQLMLVLLAVFVYFAGRAEAAMVNLMSDRQRFQNRFQNRFQSEFETPLPESDPHQSGFNEPEVNPSISADWNVKSALNWIANSPIVSVPVVRHRKVIGHISKVELFRAAASGKGQWQVGQLLAAG